MCKLLVLLMLLALPAYAGPTPAELQQMKTNVTTLMPLLSPVRHHIRVDTYSGTTPWPARYGSTDTAVMRYTVVRVNDGTAFTHSETAANGSTITINESGMYCAHAETWGDGTSGCQTAITINSTLKTTVLPTNSSEMICFFNAQRGTDRQSAACTGCFYAAIGSVLRHQGVCVVDQNNSMASFFDVVKIGK